MKQQGNIREIYYGVLTPQIKAVKMFSLSSKTNTYIAKTVNFFCIPRKTEFTPEDVKVPEVPGMFTTFSVKGKPLFVDPRLFDRPEHYAKIMGYDKPMDFKLYETSENDKKVQ
ncbi:hypothetical protein JTB14_036722 [Gonioctena quinquepunctata]|nr:hypothetical protein JTB14_036722 [Gonioctena quinquepunctata]